MTYSSWKSGKNVVATSPFSEEIFAHIPPGGAVLDLGCGNGRIAKIARDRGYEAYGVDVNADAIAAAGSDPELKHISFSVQDAAWTNFADGFFDAIIMQAVLGSMERDARILVLREAYRIAKEGGVISLAEFGMRTGRDERYRTDAEITGEYGTMIVRRSDGSEWFRSHNFTKEELEDLLERAGFRTIAYNAWEGATFHGNIHPGHRFIAKKM